LSGILQRVFPRARLAWTALFCLLFSAAAFAALSFPPLTGRVVDEAGILSPATRDQLTEILAQHEQKTGNQIVVATLKSLQGDTIEDYGYQLGRAWGIGQKGKNNGAILIVAPAEKKVRIEVGYGLEGTLTDLQSKLIIENVILPAFRRGDFSGGVLDGTAAILQVLTGEPVTLGQTAQTAASDDTQQDNGINPSWIFIALFLIWMIFGRSLWPLFFMGMPGGFRRGGIYGGGMYGGGGFGGGGFSGGGGSFGGGGASGGW
jgi:uncharacterized protein